MSLFPVYPAQMNPTFQQPGLVPMNLSLYPLGPQTWPLAPIGYQYVQVPQQLISPCASQQMTLAPQMIPTPNAQPLVFVENKFAYQNNVASYPFNPTAYQNNATTYQSSQTVYQNNPTPFQSNPTSFQNNPTPFQNNPTPFQNNSTSNVTPTSVFSNDRQKRVSNNWMPLKEEEQAASFIIDRYEGDDSDSEAFDEDSFYPEDNQDMDVDDDKMPTISCRKMEGQQEGETIYMEITDHTSDISASTQPGSYGVPEAGFEHLNFGRAQIEANRKIRLKIAPTVRNWDQGFREHVFKLIEKSTNVNEFWTKLNQNNPYHNVNFNLAKDLYQVVTFAKRVTKELSVEAFGGDHHGSKQRIIKTTQKIVEIDHVDIFKRDNELRQKVIVRLPLTSKVKLATFVEGMTILSLMIPIKGLASRNSVKKGHQSKGCTIFLWADKQYLDQAVTYLSGFHQKPKITKH